MPMLQAQTRGCAREQVPSPRLDGAARHASGGVRPSAGGQPPPLGSCLRREALPAFRTSSPHGIGTVGKARCHLAIHAAITSTVAGFATASSKPAASSAVRSTRPASPLVYATIGDRRRPPVASAMRMRPTAAMPSRTGICTSISTRCEVSIGCSPAPDLGSCGYHAIATQDRKTDEQP